MIAMVRSGSSNIEIRQPGFIDDYHYIALLDDNGRYILNGRYVVSQYPINVTYAGLTLEYSGTNATLEKVTASFAKKINRDLQVQVSVERKEDRTLFENMFTVKTALI